MPIIDQQILDCSVFIYPSMESARRGGDLGGSGFLANVRNDPHNHVYAVTNKHVARGGEAPVIRLNRHDGTADYFEIEPHDWIGHPGHDIAAIRLTLDSREHRYATVPVTAFVDPPMLDDLGIGVGDDVFMVGRYVDDRGKPTNRPMARFGNLMIAPVVPMMVANEYGGKQESILIELKSVVGFSGSPVFVRFVTRFGPEASKRSERANYGEKTLLLGVFWGHFPHTLVTADRKQVEASAGIGCVVPAWRLQELLMTPTLLDQRNQIERA